MGQVVIPYASLANDKNLLRPLGLLIMMDDVSGTTNLIHFGSSPRSIVTTEIHALILVFHQAFVIRDP